MTECNNAAHNPDFYWQSTNLEKLVDLATSNARACRAESDETIAACAEKVVRQEICQCIAGEALVVESLVEEVVRITLLNYR